jgi:Tfp pilus assembly protein PilO
MDKLRQLSLLTAVAVVAVVAGGWFLLVSPQRSKVSDLHAQAAEQKDKNATLSTEIARLEAESKDLPAEQARLAAIAEQLPPNPAMPALIGDLARAAKKSGVDLQIIAPAAPVAYTTSSTNTLVGPQSTASAAASGTSSSSTSSSTSSTSSTATTPSPSASPASAGTSSTSTSTGSTTTGAATLPASGTTAAAGGLYQIPISITAVGTYFQLTQFLNQLENLRRAYLVTAIDLKPGDPLASALTTSSGGSAGDQYDGALTAKVDGFVFEVLTSAPAGTTQTLPSAATGH